MDLIRISGRINYVDRRSLSFNSTSSNESPAGVIGGGQVKHDDDGRSRRAPPL
jgi:hypothetical protein